MNHMIPHCVRIRSSHLSCKNTENKGERQYEENNTIISTERESSLFFPQVQDIKVTFIRRQSCLIQAARVKVFVFFTYVYSVGNESKKQKQRANKRQLSITQKLDHICGSAKQFSPQASSFISLHMEIYERWQL